MITNHHMKNHNYESIQSWKEIKKVDQNLQEYEIIWMREKEINQNGIQSTQSSWSFKK